MPAVAAPQGLPVVDGRRVAVPHRDQFGFWLGSWRVRSLAGPELDGVNEVAWVLDGSVLWEQFSAGADPFTGWSFSVPDPEQGWRQTWVDNTGAYLDFTGGWCGDVMVLERERTRGGPGRQRMTWRAIGPRSLVWDWARQAHPRAGWDLVWRLGYERR